MADRNYVTARRITPGTPVTSGSGVVIAASFAGMVRLVMDDGTLLDVYAVVGTTELTGYAVKDVSSAGTTAVATITVMN